MIDVIRISGKFGAGFPPGMVAVLGDFLPTAPESFVGKVATIETEQGGRLAARICAVRDHATTISFYFEGLTPAELPIGSSIAVDA